LPFGVVHPFFVSTHYLRKKEENTANPTVLGNKQFSPSDKIVYHCFLGKARGENGNMNKM
jgi:hypothetical protein